MYARRASRKREPENSTNPPDGFLICGTTYTHRCAQTPLVCIIIAISPPFVGGQLSKAHRMLFVIKGLQVADAMYVPGFNVRSIYASYMTNLPPYLLSTFNGYLSLFNKDVPAIEIQRLESAPKAHEMMG
jgi:hypothetical protein